MNNDLGSTPLHLTAVHMGHDKLADLLAQGVDPNVRDNRGRTPLHHAAFYGYVDSVAALLDAGANPNSKDNEGWTPLNAADSGSNDRYVVKMLRDAGGKKTGWLGHLFR